MANDMAIKARPTTAPATSRTQPGGGGKKAGGAGAANELGADDLFAPGDNLKAAGDPNAGATVSALDGAPNANTNANATGSQSAAKVAGAQFGYNGDASLFGDGFARGGRKLG